MEKEEGEEPIGDRPTEGRKGSKREVHKVLNTVTPIPGEEEGKIKRGGRMKRKDVSPTGREREGELSAKKAKEGELERGGGVGGNQIGTRTEPRKEDGKHHVGFLELMMSPSYPQRCSGSGDRNKDVGNTFPPLPPSPPHRHYGGLLLLSW